jgi:hypothetical protein
VSGRESRHTEKGKEMSSEDWEGVKEAFKANAEQKRHEHEGSRMDFAMRKLTREGWTLTDRNDGHSFIVTSPIGRKFHFWPYSGWYNRLGKKDGTVDHKMWQGRGIKNLMKAGTWAEKKLAPQGTGGPGGR